MNNLDTTITEAIFSYEIDFQGKLKISSLLQKFQELAHKNADQLGFGYRQLKEKRKFWVLSRLLLEISDMPSWGDEVVISTWPKGVDNLFAIRDFLVSKPTGEVLVRATSSWLMLDENSRKPEKVEGWYQNLNLPKSSERSALDLKLGKIKIQNDVFLDREVSVKYSDLDYNGHTNHMRYIQWVLDSFSQSRFEKNRIAKFQVNFLKEAVYGEKIGIFKSWDIKDRNAHYISGAKVNNDTPCFQSKVDWVKN